MKNPPWMIVQLILRASPLVLFSPMASAYIGPGAGLSAIGSILALVGSIFLLILGFLWYPIKRLLKKNERIDQDRDDAIEDGATPEELAGSSENDNLSSN